MADIDSDGGVGSGSVGERPFADLVKVLGPPFDRRRGPERQARPSTAPALAETPRVDEPAATVPDGSLCIVAVDEIDGAAAGGALGMRALMRSIAEYGVLQPLLVRRDGLRYHVIAGRRRLAAARAAGLAKVPCVVRQMTADQATQLAAASNADPYALASQEPAGPDPAVTHQLLAQLSAGLDRIERRSADVPPVASPDPRLLEALTEELAAIEAAATLLVVDSGSMVQRVAVDLLRTQAWRAAWLLRASALVAGSRPAAVGPARPLGAVLVAVADAFAPEARLGGIEVSVSDPGWNESLPIDEQMLVCGITGGIIAMFGLLDAVKGAVIGLSATGDVENTVSIQISQDVVCVPDAARSRFFDRDWTERSGGWVAALGASVAKLCAERHGGRASLAVRAGGASLELQFPARP